MSRSGPGLRIQELPVRCATQGPPSYALRGANVEGVGIDHGCAPALGASSFNNQVPVPKAYGPARRTLCRLSADTFKLGLGLLGIPSLEWMGGGVGLGKFGLPLFARQLEISHPILALWLRNRQLHQAAQALRSQ